MRFALAVIGSAMPTLLVALFLTQAACQGVAERTARVANTTAPAALDTPAQHPPTRQGAGTSSVVIYVKVVVDKTYTVLADVLGGMCDSTWERTEYDAANPWWKNALVGYAEPPLRGAAA
jgi:hypothetical protein